MPGIEKRKRERERERRRRKDELVLKIPTD